MASVRTKKKPEEPPKGTPSYMLTYGDMMTLLLTFFVFMFNISPVPDVIKYKQAISSFRQGLGVLPGSIGVLHPDEVLLTPQEKGTARGLESEQQKLKDAKKKVKEIIERLKETKGDKTQSKEHTKDFQGEFEVRGDEKGLMITLPAEALFDSGSAEIRPALRAPLDNLAKVFKDMNVQFKIDGHTDSDPISSAAYPSNWELSSGRASRIARYMMDQHGMPPENFSVAGHADTKPICPANDTPECKQKNRRIEIRVSIVKEDQLKRINMIKELKPER